MINELPEDVLMEILAHLPVKSLIRFRWVSNSWCSLIKNPAFIYLHLKRERKKIMLLKRSLFREGKIWCDAEDVLSFHDPDSLDLLVSPDLYVPMPENIPTYPRSSTLLFGPCNGIVCIKYGKYGDRFFLCNPALREFKLCSPSLFDCPEGYAAWAQRHGFGFDPTTNVYKLVSLYDVLPSDPKLRVVGAPPCLMAYLYYSNTNSWRQIDSRMLPPNLHIGGDSECLFNGVFHWTTVRLRQQSCIVDPDLDTGSLGEFGCVGNILYFNMSNEAFGEFEFPDWGEKASSLTVLNDCLATVYHPTISHNEAMPVDIWVMKEYGICESWTKQYVIGPYLFTRSLFCWKNEHLVVEDIDGQLASCGFHTNEIKKFQFYGFETSFHGTLYKESLISVNELAYAT